MGVGRSSVPSMKSTHAVELDLSQAEKLNGRLLTEFSLDMPPLDAALVHVAVRSILFYPGGKAPITPTIIQIRGSPVALAVPITTMRPNRQFPLNASYAVGAKPTDPQVKVERIPTPPNLVVPSLSGKPVMFRQAKVSFEYIFFIHKVCELNRCSERHHNSRLTECEATDECQPYLNSQ